MTKAGIKFLSRRAGKQADAQMASRICLCGQGVENAKKEKESNNFFHTVNLPTISGKNRSILIRGS